MSATDLCFPPDKAVTAACCTLLGAPAPDRLPPLCFFGAGSSSSPAAGRLPWLLVALGGILQARPSRAAPLQQYVLSIEESVIKEPLGWPGINQTITIPLRSVTIPPATGINLVVITTVLPVNYKH